MQWSSTPNSKVQNMTLSLTTMFLCNILQIMDTVKKGQFESTKHLRFFSFHRLMPRVAVGVTPRPRRAAKTENQSALECMRRRQWDLAYHLL